MPCLSFHIDQNQEETSVRNTPVSQISSGQIQRDSYAQKGMLLKSSTPDLSTAIFCILIAYNPRYCKALEFRRPVFQARTIAHRRTTIKVRSAVWA